MLSSTLPITGAFTTVTEGYRAKTEHLPNGKYGVVLVKKPVGTAIILK